MKSVLLHGLILMILASCGKDVKQGQGSSEPLNLDALRAQGIYLWANGNGVTTLTGVVCENGVSTNLQKISYLGSFKQSVAAYRPGADYVVNGIRVPMVKISQIVDEALLVLRESPPKNASCPKQVLSAVFL